MPTYIEMFWLHEAGFSLRKLADLVSSGRYTDTRIVTMGKKELSYEEATQQSSEKLERMFKPDKVKKINLFLIM